MTHPPEQAWDKMLGGVGAYLKKLLAAAADPEAGEAAWLEDQRRRPGPRWGGVRRGAGARGGARLNAPVSLGPWCGAGQAGGRGGIYSSLPGAGQRRCAGARGALGRWLPLERDL